MDLMLDRWMPYTVRPVSTGFNEAKDLILTSPRSAVSNGQQKENYTIGLHQKFSFLYTN